MLPSICGWKGKLYPPVQLNYETSGLRLLTFRTTSEVSRKHGPIAHNEWYNSNVNAVNGTSSDTGTIATVEKFTWAGLVSTVAAARLRRNVSILT